MKDVSERYFEPTSPHLAPTSPPGSTSPQPAPGRAERWHRLDLVALGAIPSEPPAIADLFYLGKRHLVHGESETGKTWLLLAAAVAELEAGRGVVWVDGDLVGASDLLERLRGFGLDDEAIRSRFFYFQPEAPLVDSADLVRPLVESDGRLAVLDGFNPLLYLHGLDPDKGVDIESFMRRVVNPLRDNNRPRRAEMTFGGPARDLFD
jgi:hypothetical protein